MDDILGVLRVQGYRIGLKIKFKKTKSLWLGIREDEKVTLGNEKIDQVHKFTYHGSIISKDSGNSENDKSRIAKPQGAFSRLKKVRKNRKISLQTKIRIMAATATTVVKYGSEKWALRKADKDLLEVFQRNWQRFVLDTWLTDRISNSRWCKKCSPRTIMREKLRRLGLVLRMKDYKLVRIVPFGQPSKAKRKPGRLRLGLEDVVKKDLREMGNSWEGVKREV